MVRACRYIGFVIVQEGLTFVKIARTLRGRKQSLYQFGFRVDYDQAPYSKVISTFVLRSVNRRISSIINTHGRYWDCD